MQCKVDGCGRDVRYKAAQLCQMHYFRQWRYGTTDTIRQGKARPRFEDERGYQFVYAPGHPLLTKGQSYVAEHRKVLYERGYRPGADEVRAVRLWPDVEDVPSGPHRREPAKQRA
jgi:diadenosine tetraphosphatase ApaH/serine/threonine PP2A family protein phosphatase